MIKELFYKWFGLEDPPCRTCEVLQRELEQVRREKEYIMDRFFNPTPQTRPVNETQEEIKPIQPKTRFIPHAVREQLIGKEDAKTLELMQKKNKEIADAKVAALEKEIIGGEDASKVS